MGKWGEIQARWENVGGWAWEWEARNGKRWIWMGWEHKRSNLRRTGRKTWLLILHPCKAEGNPWGVHRLWLIHRQIWSLPVLSGRGPLRRQSPAKHFAMSYSPLALAEPVSSSPGADHSTEGKIREQGNSVFRCFKKRKNGQKISLHSYLLPIALF